MKKFFIIFFIITIIFITACTSTDRNKNLINYDNNSIKSIYPNYRNNSVRSQYLGKNQNLINFFKEKIKEKIKIIFELFR